MALNFILDVLALGLFHVYYFKPLNWTPVVMNHLPSTSAACADRITYSCVGKKRANCDTSCLLISTFIQCDVKCTT